MLCCKKQIPHFPHCREHTQINLFLILSWKWPSRAQPGVWVTTLGVLEVLLLTTTGREKRIICYLVCWAPVSENSLQEGEWLSCCQESSCCMPRMLKSCHSDFLRWLPSNQGNCNECPGTNIEPGVLQWKFQLLLTASTRNNWKTGVREELRCYTKRDRLKAHSLSQVTSWTLAVERSKGTCSAPCPCGAAASPPQHDAGFWWKQGLWAWACHLAP